MFPSASIFLSTLVALAAVSNGRPAGLERSLSDSQSLESPVMFQVLRPRDYNDTVVSSYDKKLVTDFPIHSSCNASNRLQLERGLFDLKRMLRTTIDHLLLYGNRSELFVTYFGAQANVATPLGVYERVLNGDKSDTLFRCDDIDGNCRFPDWGGHWRGNNATGETVICDLSYTTRKSIEKFCSEGFNLATGKINTFWATDLLHRALHLPQISDGHVEHEADGLEEAIALAKTDQTKSVINQESLQAFAYEAWSRVNVNPEGCRGLDATQVHEDASHSDADHTHSTSTAVASATSTASAAASTASQDCHTHADGTLHCV